VALHRLHATPQTVVSVPVYHLSMTQAYTVPTASLQLDSGQAGWPALLGRWRRRGPAGPAAARRAAGPPPVRPSSHTHVHELYVTYICTRHNFFPRTQ
jgi:hypothetical protein